MRIQDTGKNAGNYTKFNLDKEINTESIPSTKGREKKKTYLEDLNLWIDSETKI